MSVAASPAGLRCASETAATPGSAATAARTSRSAPSPPSGTLAASRSGPLKPGPKPSASVSYAVRVVEPARSLPSSGWPSRRLAKGAASRSSTSVPAIVARHGRATSRSAQRAKRGDGATCSGLRGRSRRANAPMSTGRTVTAPTATAPTTIADPRPMLPDEGDPRGEEPGDGDDDDRPRGDHGRAGRRVGRVRRPADVVARRELLAVAPDDQQRVVDAGAEAEHHPERRREGGERGEPRREGEEEQAAREGDPRGEQRQQHRGAPSGTRASAR